MHIIQKYKSSSFRVMLIFCISVLLLLACSRKRLIPTETIAPTGVEIPKNEQHPPLLAYSMTPTFTPESTEKPTPTGTLTAHPTLTPTVTQTPTRFSKPTPTSTPITLTLAQLPPGNYVLVRDKDKLRSGDTLYIVSTQGDMLGFIAYGSQFLGARISPDRKYLAYYQSMPGANTMTYVIDLTSNKRIADFSGCMEPSWSPDSTLLANVCQDFHISKLQDGRWVEAGSIPLPTEAQLLPDGPRSAVLVRNPAWSSDGKWLAYYVDFRLISPGWIEGPYLTDVTCMTAPDTCEAKTRKLSATKKDNTLPLMDWVFDSNHLAITQRFWDFHIDIYDAITNELTQTLSKPYPKYYGVESLVWSPDGQWIAFKSSASASVFLMPVSGGEPVIIYQGNDSSRVEVVSWLFIP